MNQGFAVPFYKVVECLVEKSPGLIREHIFPGAGNVGHLLELARHHLLEELLGLVPVPENPQLFPLAK